MFAGGARWVAGMPKSKVHVKDVRLALNHDESAVDLRGGDRACVNGYAAFLLG